MVKPTYSTDLSDTQWELIEDLFPEQVAYPNLRNDFYSFRSIVNAILYRLRTGVQYRLLPNEYPPFRRVNEWHLRWARTGLWDRILDRLRAAERARTPMAECVRTRGWQLSIARA